MYDTPPTDFDALLAPYPAEIQIIAFSLREALLHAFPQLAENVSGGVAIGIALYSVGSSERVAVGIQPGKGFVKVFLHDAHLLPASSLKLEGAGKHTRHIKLRALTPEAKAEIMALASVPVLRRSLPITPA